MATKTFNKALMASEDVKAFSNAVTAGISLNLGDQLDFFLKFVD